MLSLTIITKRNLSIWIHNIPINYKIAGAVKRTSLY
jgi:hypothetical protein